MTDWLRGYAKAQPTKRFHFPQLAQIDKLDSNLYFKGLSRAFFICRALPTCLLRFQLQDDWLITSKALFCELF